MEWVTGAGLFIIYLFMLFTVAVYTLRKGHTVLFIIGILLPVLWLIGAILPAKPGSRYDLEMNARYQRDIDQMTR